MIGNVNGQAIASKGSSGADIEFAVNKVTTFSPDGTITNTYEDGTTKITEFLSDDEVTETIKDENGNILQKKITTFNDDDSITERIAE